MIIHRHKLAISALLLALQGCAVNPVTGEREITFVSEAQELQLGGQKYAQFIFFKDEVALGHFKRGNFEFGAQASAVAITAGASADAAYDGGVAVFTNAGGGLMVEGAVSGQKFTYEKKE